MVKFVRKLAIVVQLILGELHHVLLFICFVSTYRHFWASYEILT